jgi:hypothetical protein
VLPSKIKTIETELFFGCARLEDVTFPSSLCTIERGAFSGSALRSLIVSNILYIGDFAFANSPRLVIVDLDVTIGVGRGSFYNCPSLKHLFVSTHSEGR